MDGGGLTSAAVSARLGVAVTTLRTWHQRYGLGPSGHATGRHRRYAEVDLLRLDAMRHLTSQGMPAAQAAALARETPEADLRYIDAAGRRPARAGGGAVIATGNASAAARGLADAARRLDVAMIRVLLHDTIAEHGVIAAWDELICPVLRGIGDRHGRTGGLIDVEHLLSRCVSDALAAVTTSAITGTAMVVLACADEEQHTLPLEALAAALAQTGAGSRLLGARVPPRALRGTVTRTGARVVVVWSHSPDTADPAALASLRSGSGHPAMIMAAGPGWDPERLPDGVIVPADLSEAMALAAGICAVANTAASGSPRSEPSRAPERP